MNDKETQSNKEQANPGADIPATTKASETKASETKASETKASETKAAETAATQTGPMLVGLLVWGVIVGLVVWNIPKGREFLVNYKIYVAIGLGVLALLFAIPFTRRWFQRATSTVRAGLGIFLLVPLIFLALVTLFFWTVEIQVAIIRSVLIILLCLFPGSMYFLFIATKKYSLVDEFLNNVKRLGLIDSENGARKHSGPDSETHNIDYYINKFEAVLGRLPEEFKQRLRASRSGEGASKAASESQESAGLAELFTRETLLPVVLATFLIALCWIVTLPPWKGTLTWRKVDQPSTQKPAEEPQPRSAAARGSDIERSNPGMAPVGYRNLSLSQDSAPIFIAVQEEGGAKQEAPAKSAAPPDSSGSDKKGDPWYVAWTAALTPMPRPEFYAFMGAYFFSLQMLFRRYVRRDLRPSAYVSVSIRIAIAVIGTWAAVEATKIVGFVERGLDGPALLVLGFTIGVFPRVAWQVIGGASAKLFGDKLNIPSFQTKLPISDIDGVTSWHEARLEEEDIENVPNMATADIVDLILNTRIPTDRIVDWMDQAILYTHIGPENQEAATTRRKLLRSHGIYTASALVHGYEESVSGKFDEEFAKILGAGAPSLVVCLVDAVKTNPNLKPIMRWRHLI